MVCRPMAARLSICTFLLVTLLDLAAQNSPSYEFMENALHGLNMTRHHHGDVMRRFPPPPVFPPPPPAFRKDPSVMLVRDVIYENIREIIEKGVTTVTDDDILNTIPAGPGGSTPSPAYLNTDIPACLAMSTMSSERQTGSGITHFDTCPAGPPGPPGPAGPTGPGGKTGKRGKRGKMGRAGASGPRGLRGFTGGHGPSGPRGRVGLQGPVGMPGPQGPPGPAGDHGQPGPPGQTGKPGHDGLPALVLFHDEATMQGVALEGLLAYRKDTKRLYFRDDVTWRVIKMSKCGDGLVDHDVGERCDDGNDSVTDACANCHHAYCGDGFVHAGQEECDGRNFDGQSCAMLRPGMLGTLICSSRCTISFARCRWPTR